MKYEKVKKVIWGAGCSRINDQSPPGNNHKYSPLWMILEHRGVGLRIWVTHDFGRLEITTAPLDMDIRSEEYARAHKRYFCKNQTDMAEKLDKIFKARI